MITSSKTLKDKCNITIGCLPEAMDTLQKIYIEDTDVYISVSDIRPSQYLLDSKTYYWFPIDEIDKWELETFKNFWKTIEKHWGQNIYIHCTAGVNRSRCMVYSFLKFRLKWNTEDILECFLTIKSLDESFWCVDRLWKLNQSHGHIPSDEKLEKLSLEMLSDTRNS